MRARIPVLAALVCAVVTPSVLRAQIGPVSAVIGVNTFTDGSGEGMFGGELRLAAGPRTWRVRPVVAVAGFTNMYASQGELQVGAGTTFPLGGRWSMDVGAGLSRLSLSGAAASGSSNAGYVRAAALLSGGVWGSGVGLDVRVLHGPDRRREDGLRDPVGFVQVGAVIMLGRGRQPD